MRLVLIFMSLCLLVIACGEKLPLPDNISDDGDGRLTDTTYVPLLPHWTSLGGLPLSNPFGVAVGYDRTIYICDTDNDRIVRLTATGDFIESYSLPHPYAVAQDRSFALAAVNGSTKVWMRHYPDGGDFAVYAEMDSTWRCFSQPDGTQVCWWDVPELATITATREARSLFYTIGPARINYMLGDRYQPDPQFYPVGDSSGVYGGLLAPTSMVSALVRGKRRLIVTQYPQQPDLGAYGVLYLAVPSYRPVFADVGQDVFRRPLSDVKYLAADDVGNVYVLHRINGIVMKFDKDGDYLLSFGHAGADDYGLNAPRGIAVLDDIVFIADTKNNRIARFQMTAVPQN